LAIVGSLGRTVAHLLWDLRAAGVRHLAVAGYSDRVPDMADHDQAGRALRGEVSLAMPLRAKAAAGATLFIVAKSVDSPGAPVAVFRGTVADVALSCVDIGCGLVRGFFNV